MNKKIVIDTEKCKGCELCINTCKSKSLSKSSELNKLGYHPVVFIDKNCNSCGLCFIVCPDVAIEVYK